MIPFKASVQNQIHTSLFRQCYLSVRDLCSNQPWSKVPYPGKFFWGEKKKKKYSSPPFSPETRFYLLQAAEILGNQSPKPSGRNHQGMFLTHCHRSWPTTIANVPGLFLFPLSSPKQTQLQIRKILQWNFALMGLNVCHLCKNTLHKNSTVVG